MSMLNIIKAKLGQAANTAYNFLLDASAADGTMKLARESGQAIMTVAADGKVSFPQGVNGVVSSVNGQSGAVVTTDAFAIGGYVIGRPADANTYSVGAIVAGSVLYTTTASTTPYNSGSFTAYAGQSLVNIGTWRCVSTAYGNGTSGLAGLWVRIS